MLLLLFVLPPLTTHWIASNLVLMLFLLLVFLKAPMAQWLSSANGLVGTGFASRYLLQT